MRKFRHVNEEFSCENCGLQVPKAKSTCRNHCPFCLFSKHVDINPGDRANECKGLLKPTGYELSGKKGIILHFTCVKCGKTTRNRAIQDDPFQTDDYDKILGLGL